MSELLQIAVPDDNAATGASAASTYFLALLAFVGGFSERLTHVVLGQAEKTIAATFEHDDSEMIATRPVAPEAPVDASLTQLERWTQLRDQGAHRRGAPGAEAHARGVSAQRPPSGRRRQAAPATATVSPTSGMVRISAPRAKSCCFDMRKSRNDLGSHLAVHEDPHDRALETTTASARGPRDRGAGCMAGSEPRQEELGVQIHVDVAAGRDEGPVVVDEEGAVELGQLLHRLAKPRLADAEELRPVAVQRIEEQRPTWPPPRPRPRSRRACRSATSRPSRAISTASWTICSSTCRRAGVHSTRSPISPRARTDPSPGAGSTLCSTSATCRGIPPGRELPRSPVYRASECLGSYAGARVVCLRLGATSRTPNSEAP